jgi:DNA-binding NtrC family response regulator
VPNEHCVVFVVDDEVLIAQTLAMILSQAGFRANAFSNPEKAVAACAELRPDVLLCDVMMPQLSGIDLAIQIERLCPACKILLFSGQAATADLLSEARDKGYDFVLLLKPVHPTDLLKHIRALTI